MKAYRVAFDPQNNFSLEEFEAPAPAFGEIMVKVAYSLISPGTELGGYNLKDRKQMYYPGYTAVGKVLDAGSAKDRELIGQTVFLYPDMDDSTQCHATCKLLKPGGLALPVPEGLSPEIAGFARMINVALTPFCHIPPRVSGGYLLILGLGLIGNLVGQIGKLLGFRTIGVEPDPGRRARARQAGLDLLIDPSSQDTLAVIMEASGGKGVDFSVNANGRSDSFELSVRAAAVGGEISTLGGARVPARVELMDIINEIHYRHLTVRGGWELRLPMKNAGAEKIPSIEANLNKAFYWLRNNKIKLDPIHTHTLAPSDFKKAYDQLNGKSADYLGVVIDWEKPLF
ncbi:MAG: zinc-binding dehydrogenase [Victivallaceae bacterium]|nr:zinc-binding dehydrogenase [Victivallaceae bacterium]